MRETGDMSPKRSTILDALLVELDRRIAALLATEAGSPERREASLEVRTHERVINGALHLANVNVYEFKGRRYYADGQGITYRKAKESR